VANAELVDTRTRLGLGNGKWTTRDQRAAVGQSKSFVETEERQVTKGAQKLTINRGQPRLGSVFDQ
jgi:hypothetical protein